MTRPVKTFAVAYVLGFLGIGVYKNRKQIIDTASHIIQQILSHGDCLIPHLDSIENGTETNTTEINIEKNKTEEGNKTDSMEKECGDVIKGPARIGKPNSNVNLLGLKLESESLLNVLDYLMNEGKKTDSPSEKRSVQILHINSNLGHESEDEQYTISQDTPSGEKTNDLHEVQQVVKSLENLFEALGDTGSGTTYTVLNEQDSCPYTCVEFEVSVKFGNVRENFRSFNSGYVICKYNTGPPEDVVNDNSTLLQQDDNDLKENNSFDVTLEKHMPRDGNSKTVDADTHILHNSPAKEIQQVRAATKTLQDRLAKSTAYQSIDEYRGTQTNMEPVFPASNFLEEYYDNVRGILSATDIEPAQKTVSCIKSVFKTSEDILAETDTTSARYPTIGNEILGSEMNRGLLTILRIEGHQAQSSTSGCKLAAFQASSDEQYLAAQCPASEDVLVQYSSTASGEELEELFSPRQSIRTLADMFETGVRKSQASCSALSCNSTLSSISIKSDSWDMSGLEH